MNDTRPVTSADEAHEPNENTHQPVHIGGAAEGDVVGGEPPRAEAAPASDPVDAALADPESDLARSPAPDESAGYESAGYESAEDEQPEEADEAAGAAIPDEAPPDLPLFADLGLSDELVRAVTEKGYLHPTPIQAQAIPFVLMGRDVLGVAQTGTGKTAGFTLPLLDILSGSRARARMPRSLILEPTRELALQVAENFLDYGRHLKLTHALLIGGESMSDQREALDKGVDVLIATPGRLLDLFERGGLLLNDTRILVIDEADRMLDMGFIPDVERIVSLVSPMRQTLFFSATMAPEIRRLADAFLQNPKEISVSRAASVASTIVTGLAVVPEDEKRRALRALLEAEDVQNALIFCNRKRDVDILAKSLVKHGFSAGALHGDLPQSVRFATLERFKAGELKMLVCSDVAARGLDIGGLSHVFNFDIPIHAEDYVHRIGRTGRAGRTGHAYSIASPDDRLVVDAIETLTGTPIPRIEVAGVPTAPWSEIDGRKRRGGRRGSGSPAVGRDRASGGRDRAAGGGSRERTETAERSGRESRAPRRENRADVRPSRAEHRAPMPEASRSVPEASRSVPEASRSVPEASRPGPEASRPGPEASRPTPQPARPAPQVLDDRPRRFERDRPRRDRDGEFRHRREDLGPSVLGFGDLVPDFMKLPRRTDIASARAAAGIDEAFDDLPTAGLAEPTLDAEDYLPESEPEPVAPEGGFEPEFEPEDAPDGDAAPDGSDARHHEDPADESDHGVR